MFVCPSIRLFIDLRFEGAYLRSERPDLRSERPDMRSERLELRTERPDFRSEEANYRQGDELGPERLLRTDLMCGRTNLRLRLLI